jgi:perosamine synthetase
MYGVVIDPRTGLDAAAASRLLAEQGVATRPFFLGMHRQPAFHALGLFEGEEYAVADHLSKQGLYLPSGLALTDSQVEATAAAVHSVLEA